ncbi:acyclic terpene utilization AtuA family protein [Variovorax sp.]|uniref:acyclic terpene utilization AtuA family protein n=1 Tax=Variovorax sp. TaxID=1871043 RepID=UPI002D462AEB|nr:acyclic terpene utilization AtuA family protein [Variovorax sp.]HYP84349.1 acyclic terpene utilization AtuA family protein [Variovorax sp.]
MSNASPSHPAPPREQADAGALLVGCAAGFSGDRTDAAGPVVDTLIARLRDGPAGSRAFLIFETLAERTLALAQLRRRADSEAGYEPLLDAMLRPVLARCLAHGIRIVSNFGAANPRAAARHILRMAHELGAPAPRVAVVEGDDLSSPAQRALLREQIGSALDALDVVSANAYIGAEPIALALDDGAQIVVCGRVADPSLTVGPAMSHFGWRADDWPRLGRATMAGHLLECGAQVTGGYFADPGYKDVPGMAALGFPIAEIDADGGCVIGKADGTGGAVTEASVKEQLLYEVHDPAAYLTPDVVADLSQARVQALGPDRVRLSGVTGHPRPAQFKVNVCHEGGWLAEGEISYAGPRAEARARLAAQVLRERLPGLSLRVDLIGAVSILADDAGATLAATPEQGLRDVRLRVAATHARRAEAELLAREVTALYTCGPAGGGGVRTALTQRLNTVSCLLARRAVPVRVQHMGAEDAPLAGETISAGLEGHGP